ncbi:conjugal transfer protein TrbI (plasmid) [Yersinia pseudotuberculosis IP 31758]|uniref:Conjugal transfer protein TrbI n=1 Tax=Yersinia pseudotuberculosis serotype O:1b (strain IP 31758) TaxID=349747 RepID=A0A0U1QTB0_YERP3|nr:MULTISPECIES: TrbI/VirB10 family protein [Yersinia pseudotuberculosis complex]ABS45619.1 conjugal transfer protein TrbI [Yersinia pseudotuberculosis IP 31758]
MANTDNQMSPSNSPGSIGKTGVRRVNNLPLIIVLSVITIFIAIIAMVAVKRSDQQNQAPETPKSEKTVSSSSMAADIVAGHNNGIIPPEQITAPTQASEPTEPTEPTTAIPVAKVDNPNEPPVPPRNNGSRQDIPNDPDLDRIKMAKLQQFEEAVKAKTTVSIPTLRDNATGADGATPTRDQTLARLEAVRRQIDQTQNEDPTSAYKKRLQQLQGNGGMSGDNASSGGDGLATSSSNDIEQFAGTGVTDRWALNTKVEAPRSPFEIRAGAVVPGVMISGVNSDLPGQIMGQVTQDVFDTPTGKHLLIPQGTRLTGSYTSDVAFGQSAVMIAWQRMIFPDGKALDIAAMPGADSAGYSGFRDQVNNHLFRIFSSAFLLSGVTAGVTYSQGRNENSNGNNSPTASSALSEALGQQFGQVTAQMIAKNLNIAPTLEIRPGYRFNIIVIKDMTFKKPYKPFDY